MIVTPVDEEHWQMIMVQTINGTSLTSKEAVTNSVDQTERLN